MRSSSSFFRLCLVLNFCIVVVAEAQIETTKTSSSSSSNLAEQKLPDCKAGSKVFFFTGTVEKFVAPRGCVVVAALWGAGGSNSIRSKGAGGGGYLRGAFTGYGQDIYLLVGEGAHGDAEGERTQGPFFGGGGMQGRWCGHAGGGGGRSQISLSPNDKDVDGVILVAGGGGGAGTCPDSRGGSGGCRDDQWEPHCNGYKCNAEWNVWGKGGYGGRPHNDFFLGHPGGDLGGGGGGGYYGGGGGEGSCDFGSGGGGGSTWWNTDFIFSAEYKTAQNAVAGNNLLEFGLDVGMGATSALGRGGHGLIMLNWYPIDAKQKHPMTIVA